LQGGAEVFAEVGVVGREFDGSGVFLAALCILAGFKERGGEIGMRFEVVPIGLEDFAKFADGWRASVLQKKCNGVIHAGVEERRFQRERFKEAGFGLREMHFGHLDEAGGVEEFGTVGMGGEGAGDGLDGFAAAVHFEHDTDTAPKRSGFREIGLRVKHVVDQRESVGFLA
jgi:hypothetical protein